jgi:hypothetical protein
MRLSTASVVRYILAAKQGDSDLFALKMEAIRSSETYVLTKTTGHRLILEDGVRRSNCREHLKSYIALSGWTL